MLKQSLPQFTGDFEREFQDGEVIFNEGDDSREMYVIESGQISIRKKIAGSKEVQLVCFQRGDFVGEMALLESLPRFASAYAIGVTKVLVLRPGGFLLKIRRDPTFAFEMLQQLSRRIRITNERMLEMVIRGNADQAVVEEILQSTEIRYNEQRKQESFDSLLTDGSENKDNNK
jgi:CRP/FNR family cyclic AMP-dependent transcriptional regulator